MNLPPRIPPSIPILENKVQLLGISGHSGVGKTEICDYLLRVFSNTYQLAFADALKSGCAELFGIRLMDFYESGPKEEVNKIWGTTPRKIAQFVGSEFFRDKIAQLIPWVATEFWIYRFAGTINSRLYFPQDQDDFASYDSDDVIVIPDVRFQNEYDFIIANGGMILHVTRAGCDGNIGIIGHQSERGFIIHSPEQTVEFSNQSNSLEVLHKELEYTLEHNPKFANFSLDPYKSLEL